MTGKGSAPRVYRDKSLWSTATVNRLKLQMVTCTRDSLIHHGSEKVHLCVSACTKKVSDPQLESKRLNNIKQHVSPCKQVTLIRNNSVRVKPHVRKCLWFAAVVKRLNYRCSPRYTSFWFITSVKRLNNTCLLVHRNPWSTSVTR